MSKRIIAIVLCAVILLGLIAAVVPVLAAAATEIKITADKTLVEAGDTVTYTMSLGAVENMAALKLKLVIPAGLNYVEGSGKTAAGLQDALNAAKAEFTEQTKIFIVGSSDYTGDSEIVLMQFQCVVAENATGPLEVGIDVDTVEMFNSEYADIDFHVVTATVITDCEHSWENATCTAPKTCSICLTVEGEALGHTIGENYTSDADGHWLSCTLCGENAGSEAHEDENADLICDVCSYRLSNPQPETPTEPEKPADSAEPEAPAEGEKPETSEDGEADDSSLWIVVAVVVVVLLAAGGAAVILRKKFSGK